MKIRLSIINQYTHNYQLRTKFKSSILNRKYV